MCWINTEERFVIAGFISESFQLQAQVTLIGLGWRHKSGEGAKSRARRSVGFCSQRGGGASIRLFT